VIAYYSLKNAVFINFTNAFKKISKFCFEKYNLKEHKQTNNSRRRYNLSTKEFIISKGYCYTTGR